MAISSYKVFLMGQGESNAWNKLIDIKDFPDLGAAPEMLETTTLSDRARTYIPGIQENEAMTFTANYTKAEFDRLYALRGTLHGFAVWLGGTENAGSLVPTGTYGKYAFGGYIDVFVNSAGVNEVVDMTITIAPTTEISVDGTIDWRENADNVLPITT